MNDSQSHDELLDSKDLRNIEKSVHHDTTNNSIPDKLGGAIGSVGGNIGASFGHAGANMGSIFGRIGSKLGQMFGRIGRKTGELFRDKR